MQCAVWCAAPRKCAAVEKRLGSTGLHIWRPLKRTSGGEGCHPHRSRENDRYIKPEYRYLYMYVCMHVCMYVVSNVLCILYPYNTYVTQRIETHRLSLSKY